MHAKTRAACLVLPQSKGTNSAMTSGQNWVDTGWYLRPKSARELFAAIGAVGGLTSKASLAWRGMSSIDFDLISSLQRTPIRSEEHLRNEESRLISEARDWGLGYGPGGWSTDLQLLADLQHYGTSTRLIDVTSNPMTALWFACQSPQQPSVGRISTSGVLIAINVEGWKHFGRAHPASTRAAVGNPLSWELEAALGRKTPFVVDSLQPNDRLRAQEGFFLAGAMPPNVPVTDPFKSFAVPFTPLPPHQLAGQIFDTPQNQQQSWRNELPFVAVKISSELKPRVLARLEASFARTPRTLFPDFSGFRDYSHFAAPRKIAPGLRSRR